MIPFSLCLLALFITGTVAFTVGHSLGFNLGEDSGWDACEEFLNQDDIDDITWSRVSTGPTKNETHHELPNHYPN